MNNNASQTSALIKDLKSVLNDMKTNCRVIISPTSINLSLAVQESKDSVIEVSAQNMHEAESGAYTGEISADMLLDVGVKTVIIGHSERRTYFNESVEQLADKVNTALAKGLEVIFCFGESLNDRKLENEFLEVGSQIKNSLFHLAEDAWKNIVLAYEPVWAIGTGETASPEQAQEMHAFIRQIVEKKYSKETADNVSILYGGSVKPSNAVEIFSKKDVDGGLIGGASLKAEDFKGIITAF